MKCYKRQRLGEMLIKPGDFHYCGSGADTWMPGPQCGNWGGGYDGGESLEYLSLKRHWKIKSNKDSQFCRVQQNYPQGFGTIPWISQNMAVISIQTSYNWLGIFRELLRTGTLNHSGNKYNRKSMTRSDGFNFMFMSINIITRGTLETGLKSLFVIS